MASQETELRDHGTAQNHGRASAKQAAARALTAAEKEDARGCHGA